MAPSDDDLRLLLHSPALSIEPPATLVTAVHRRARRQRVRTRLAGVGAAVGLGAVAVLLGPTLLQSADSPGSDRGQLTGIQRDPRFPAATTDVITLERINGAEVLTWFQGSRWCTATTRQTTRDACQGPVNPEHKGFGWILPAGSPSLTVDNEHVVAGVLPRGASRVGVHMTNGHEYAATVVDGARFVVPIWSAVVDDRSNPVAYYVAYDAAGTEISRQLA